MMSEDFKSFGTCKFRIKNEALVTDIWQKALKYQQFTNLYIIIRNILYKNQLDTENRIATSYKIPQDINHKDLYKYFLENDVIRAAVKNRVGGKKAFKVEVVQRGLEDWQLYKDLKEVSKDLQIKNLYKELKKVNAGFKSFYTKQKNGDKDARPPKPKKFSKAHRITIPIDQDCLSFKKKDFVKVNINSKMIEFALKHATISKVTYSVENIQSAELISSQSELVLSLLYKKKIPDCTITSKTKTKAAGLDLGIKNIASLFVDDKTTSSLLIDGKDFIAFNAKSNRKIAKNRSSLDILMQKSSKEPLDDCLKQQIAELKKRLSTLFSKRREYYQSNFHKLSRRLLEDLQITNVTDLYVSRNLGECKNTDSKSMGKENNQKFYQIPILKLIDYLELKTSEFGIRVHYIDEAYTSKCSSVSGDVLKAKEIFNESKTDNEELRNCKKTRRNVLNGRRIRRSIYKDYWLKKQFHADINAAVNHIKVGLGMASNAFEWLKSYIWKLANPIKIKALNCYLDRPLA